MIGWIWLSGIILMSMQVHGEPPVMNEPISPNIDDWLGGIERPFCRYPATLSFGPTGRRLWVNYLTTQPGFDGLIDYIHKTNIPALYHLEFEINGTIIASTCTAHRWYPSHLEREHTCGPLRIRENLFITGDDAAVDVVSVTNTSDALVRFRIRSTSALELNKAGYGLRETHGEEVRYAFMTFPMDTVATIPPGKSVIFRFALAFGLAGEDPAKIAARWSRDTDAAETHRTEYLRWFESAPKFECDNELFNRMWDYRWYLARRNLAHPGAGLLKEPLFWEGRAHKCSNDPWKPSGWEFSKLIPFSSPYHILEGLWHKDLSAVHGEIRNLIAAQSEEGLFRCAYIHDTGGSYYHFIPWAVWELHCIRPDRTFLAETAPAMARNVEAWARLYDTDGDGLIEVTNHGRTGKEYQPSYWYFSDYPEDSKQGQAVLERVDATVYFILNASSVAMMYQELGLDGTERFKALAGKSRQAMLKAMWDPETRFFYDVRKDDNAQARVRNVVGFDPFLDLETPESGLDVFKELSNPSTFAVKCPLPSVEINNPAFAPDASWAGVHIKGPHGAMWNGPSWPFTNTTALMSLGNAAQRFPGRGLENQYSVLFDSYTRMMQRNGRPMVVEHYNPLTGEEISQEEDYYHSAWIWLVIRYIVGLVPRNDDVLELRPVDVGLKEFRCEGVLYRSRHLEVKWKQGEGLQVFVDGSKAADKQKLDVVVIHLPDRMKG